MNRTKLFITLAALLPAAACEQATQLVAPAPAFQSAAQGTISYTLALTGARYDEARAQTSFTYRVTSNPDGGPAISHWVIALGDCFTAADLAGASEQAAFTQADPTTGVRGVKFDTGYGDQEARTVTVSLRGRVATGDAKVAVKSGNGFVLGTVQGPVCAAAVAEGPAPRYTISGVVFFDANADGVRGADEPGIAGAPVTLSNGARVVSGPAGEYRFEQLATGDYGVKAAEVAGTRRSTADSVAFPALARDERADFGYRIDLASLEGKVANGFTIGYWKNNLDKAIAGTTKGVQVSAATLRGYVATLSTFALAPLNFTTLVQPREVMSSTSPAPAALLAKQLTGSELNYASGAYIGGDAAVTGRFVYYGEYVLAHPSEFTPAQVLEAKDWFDAYNNSHGGAIVRP